MDDVRRDRVVLLCKQPPFSPLTIGCKFSQPSVLALTLYSMLTIWRVLTRCVTKALVLQVVCAERFPEQCGEGEDGEYKAAAVLCTPFRGLMSLMSLYSCSFVRVTGRNDRVRDSFRAPGTLSC